MSERIKTAIVGPGAWGRNVARELAAASELVAYASREPARHRQWAAGHVPNARALTVEQIAADPAIKAVAIATPVPTLSAIARRMIEAGKHVLTEKPVAQTSADAQRLADAAAARGVVLVAGYVFVHHAAYRELKRRVDPASVRKVAFRWGKFGTFGETIEQSLLTHHLALALDFLGEPASGTIAHGPGIRSGCDRVEVRLAYPRAEIESLIDRASAQKTHTTTVVREDGSSLIWDGDCLFAVRDGARSEVFRAEAHSALAFEVEQFVAAASGASAPPPTAGIFAARVLGILEMLER